MANPEQLTLKIQELKAQAYDLIAVIQQSQMRLGQVNQEIMAAEKELSATAKEE